MNPESKEIMEIQGNSLPGDSVVRMLDTSGPLDSSAELSDCVGVDVALEEAMDLEDTGTIGAIERKSNTNDAQDTTEIAKQGEVNSKATDLNGETEKMTVANLREVESEQITDNRRKLTDALHDNSLVEDKSLVRDDTQGEIIEKTGEVRQETKEVTVVRNIIMPVNTEGQEGTKIPITVVQKEAEIVATISEKGKDNAVKIVVEMVQDNPVSQDVKTQQVEEKAESKIKENLPASAVNVEKCILVETREETRPTSKLVKVQAPKVPPPKVTPPNVPPPNVQTLQPETEPGGKPCDRITKAMVPTMQEGLVEEALKLSAQIEFHKGVTPLALLSKARWLVRQADVTLVPKDQTVMSFFRSLRRTTYHLFLFNDTFVVCKKKGASKFMAVNYCQRNLVLITKASSVDRLPEKVRKDTPGKSKVYLTMLENHEKKAESLVLSFANCVDRDEWIKLFKTPASTNPQEMVFEMWDCPLVKVVNDFEATKPEEMTVHKDEKIYVLRKCTNGFYEGERLNDQKRGYFPISATVELSSEHSRALQIRNKHTDTTF